MKVFGAQLAEGSAFSNLTVASGLAFPAQPNSGELFYRTDADTRIVGLYVHIENTWVRIASNSAVTIPSAGALPALANTGDLFFNTAVGEGLSVYDGATWVRVVTGIAEGPQEFIVREIPSGIQDGANASFVLAYTPLAGTEHVYVSGMLMDPGALNDYVLTANTITFSFFPSELDKIRVSYMK